MSRVSLRERLIAKRATEAGDSVAPLDGQWYVLHTYSGYENKVKKSIETRIEALDLTDRVYEIVVPTQDEIEIRSGQRHTVQKKVFPGYVLVRMEMDDDTWYALRNTPGVTGFVNINNVPVPLPESEVQSIIKGMTAGSRSRSRLAIPCALRTVRSPTFGARLTRLARRKARSAFWSRSSDGRRRSNSISCRLSGKHSDEMTPS